MRRIIREKKITKSKEKELQKNILRSVNEEKQNRDKVKKETKNLTENLEKKERDYLLITNQINELKKAQAKGEEKRDKLHEEILTLEEKRDLLKLDIDGLEKDVHSAKIKLSLARGETEKEITRLDNLKNERHSSLNKEVVALEKTIAEKQAKIDILTINEEKIGATIEQRGREKIAMDASIARRMQELAQINYDIATTQEQSKRAKDELNRMNERLARVEKELTDFDKEIEKREKQVAKAEKQALEKRNEVIALVKREQRLNELIPAVRDLYAKAGIKIDL